LSDVGWDISSREFVAKESSLLVCIVHIAQPGL